MVMPMDHTIDFTGMVPHTESYIDLAAVPPMDGMTGYGMISTLNAPRAGHCWIPLRQQAPSSRGKSSHSRPHDVRFQAGSPMDSSLALLFSLAFFL